MRAIWTLETCPSCEGSGWDYCQSCERCCEHDRLCGMCHGEERIPVRARGLTTPLARSSAAARRRAEELR